MELLPQPLNISTININKLVFLSGGEKIGECICDFNWSKTALAPVEEWL